MCSHTRRDMFTLSMIETISRGSFDLSQTKQVSANIVPLSNIALSFVPEGLDK